MILKELENTCYELNINYNKLLKVYNKSYIAFKNAFSFTIIDQKLLTKLYDIYFNDIFNNNLEKFMAEDFVVVESNLIRLFAITFKSLIKNGNKDIFNDYLNKIYVDIKNSSYEGPLNELASFIFLMPEDIKNQLLKDLFNNKKMTHILDSILLKSETEFEYAFDDKKLTRLIALYHADKNNCSDEDEITLDQVKDIEMLLRNSFDINIVNLQRYKTADYETNYALFTKYRLDPTIENRNEILLRNWRLAFKYARKYYNSRVDLGDLFQEGLIGIIIAIEKFDHTRGYKFSTYATAWIKREIFALLNIKSNFIRIPQHISKKIYSFYATREKLINELNRMPRNEEIAERLGISLQELEDLERTLIQPISINRQIEEGDGLTLEEIIKDMDAIDPEEQTIKNAMQQDVVQMLTYLNPREKDVIEHRYGLVGGRIYTLEEIGKKYNLTRERVRQIENKAQDKLRINRCLEGMQIYVNNNFDKTPEDVSTIGDIINKIKKEFTLEQIICGISTINERDQKVLLEYFDVNLKTISDYDAKNYMEKKAISMALSNLYGSLTISNVVKKKKQQTLCEYLKNEYNEKEVLAGLKILGVKKPQFANIIYKKYNQNLISLNCKLNAQEYREFIKARNALLTIMNSTRENKEAVITSYQITFDILANAFDNLLLVKSLDLLLEDDKKLIIKYHGVDLLNEVNYEEIPDNDMQKLIQIYSRLYFKACNVINAKPAANRNLKCGGNKSKPSLIALLKNQYSFEEIDEALNILAQRNSESARVIRLRYNDDLMSLRDIELTAHEKQIFYTRACPMLKNILAGKYKDKETGIKTYTYTR